MKYLSNTCNVVPDICTLDTRTIIETYQLHYWPVSLLGLKFRVQIQVRMLLTGKTKACMTDLIVKF